MTLTEQQKKRINELLADRAVFGLTAEEQNQLTELLGDTVDDPSEYDVIGSLLLSSEIETANAMPDALAEKIRTDAVLQTPSNQTTSSQTAVSSAADIQSIMKTDQQSFSLVGVTGWVVAACLFVVASIGWMRDTSEPVVANATIAELRQELMQNANDVISVDWLPSEDPAAKAATGDVVWSHDQQSGYMRISGLAANDSTIQQYQLWIIDGKRDAAKPIDGGVFDIPAGTSEVIIPIDAKLLVYDARAFAITIEKPGGVVVSDRERLPLLASVGA